MHLDYGGTHGCAHGVKVPAVQLDPVLHGRHRLGRTAPLARLGVELAGARKEGMAAVATTGSDVRSAARASLGRCRRQRHRPAAALHSAGGRGADRTAVMGATQPSTRSRRSASRQRWISTSSLTLAYLQGTATNGGGRIANRLAPLSHLRGTGLLGADSRRPGSANASVVL